MRMVVTSTDARKNLCDSGHVRVTPPAVLLLYARRGCALPALAKLDPFII